MSFHFRPVQSINPPSRRSRVTREMDWRRAHEQVKVQRLNAAEAHAADVHRTLHAAAATLVACAALLASAALA